MENEQTNETFDLEPNLTYNGDLGAARVEAQGIGCTVTAEMFEVAEAKGPTTLSKDIPHRDIAALFNAQLDQPFRLSIALEPIEEIGVDD
jgi:hypothetical protein